MKNRTFIIPVAGGGGSGSAPEVVETLPDVSEAKTGVIYLVKDNGDYDKYILAKDGDELKWVSLSSESKQWFGKQSEFDALESYDPDTDYFINEISYSEIKGAPNIDNYYKKTEVDAKDTVLETKIAEKPSIVFMTEAEFNSIEPLEGVNYMIEAGDDAIFDSVVNEAIGSLHNIRDIGGGMFYSFDELVKDVDTSDYSYIGHTLENGDVINYGYNIGTNKYVVGIVSMSAGYHIHMFFSSDDTGENKWWTLSQMHISGLTGNTYQFYINDYDQQLYAYINGMQCKLIDTDIINFINPSNDTCSVVSIKRQGKTYYYNGLDETGLVKFVSDNDTDYILFNDAGSFATQQREDLAMMEFTFEDSTTAIYYIAYAKKEEF